MSKVQYNEFNMVHIKKNMKKARNGQGVNLHFHQLTMLPLL